MAEFCLNCWNRMHGTRDLAWKYVIDEDLNLCEGCGKYRHTIVASRWDYYCYKLRYVFLPFKIVWITLIIIYRILTMLYHLYRLELIKNKLTVLILFIPYLVTMLFLLLKYL